jgi:hypothetical protein
MEEKKPGMDLLAQIQNAETNCQTKDWHLLL